MVGSDHPTALPTGRHPGVRVVIKWAYEPALRRRRLRRERLEKAVSKVTAPNPGAPVPPLVPSAKIFKWRLVFFSLFYIRKVKLF